MASEKNKTAMLELIDYLKTFNLLRVNEMNALALDGLIDRFLEKEKEQIKQAYFGGLGGFINDYPEDEGELISGKKTIIGGGAEKYYNETYPK